MTMTILKLDETNYAEWVVLMHALLVRKGLWEVTGGMDTERLMGSDGSKAVKAWVKKTEEARAELALSVDRSQLAHVCAGNAADVWLRLETMHQARGFGTRLALCRKFYAMKMSGSMQAWISEVASAAFRLEAAGVSVTDKDQILVLMNGLPPSYDSFAVSLDVTSPSELTLNHTVIRLINEYERQAVSKPTPKFATPKDPGLAAAVLRSEMPPRARRPIAKITCFKCGNKGHYQANCPNNATPPTSTLTTGTASSAYLVEALEEVEESDDSERILVPSGVTGAW